MNKRKKIYILSLLSVGFLFLALGFYNFWNYNNENIDALSLEDFGFYEAERPEGEFFTIVDEQGNVLDKMSRVVHVGDELIGEDDNLHRVERIVGSIAYAKLVEKDVLAEDKKLAQEYLKNGTAAVAANNKKNLVAIYHTHSAESYVPTDGTESIPGKGGIFKVGNKMTTELENMGVQVKHSKSSHEPRDSQAYLRSRRTATKLLASRPAAIIDVHRDGIPDPDFYDAKIAGNEATKIRLVVGRQNQNMNSNLDFAKKVKAGVNEIYPGLVKSIFMAKGNYNQDLTPRSLLAEVGTHTNSRERAEAGAKLFADALPKVLGIAGPLPGQENTTGGVTTPDRSTPKTGGDYTSLFWILGVTIIGVAAFLLVSTGSVKGSIGKLKSFASEEFTNYLGKMPQKQKKDQQTNKNEDNEKSD